MLQLLGKTIANFSRIKLPHIFWPKKIGWTLTILLIITALLNLYGLFFPKQEQLAKLKQKILINPFSSQHHKELGSYYLKAGNVKEAAVEYEIAYILGSTNVLEEYKEAINTNKRIKEEIVFWESQLKEKSDYRDAYLKLASQYYQLQDTKKTRVYLEKASQIDPNYEPAAQLEKLLY